MPRYRIRHTTRYGYGGPVSGAQHRLHLTPRPQPRQQVHSHALWVDPAPDVRDDGHDGFGNPETYLALEQPHRSLTITAETELTVIAPMRFDPTATPVWREVARAAAAPAIAAELAVALGDSALVPLTDALHAYAAPSFGDGVSIAVALGDLLGRLHAEFVFDPGATDVYTPLTEVLARRRGVCQDFAHLGVGCLRAVGIPARYVSGYLRTVPPPGRPRLVGADASHAWVSAWCGTALGWCDLCPTNGKFIDEDYVTTAWGRDYDDVSPVRGVIQGGGAQSLGVEVDVEPLDDHPVERGPPA